jgi:hypothetical protein
MLVSPLGSSICQKWQRVAVIQLTSDAETRLMPSTSVDRSADVGDLGYGFESLLLVMASQGEALDVRQKRSVAGQAELPGEVAGVQPDAASTIRA